MDQGYVLGNFIILGIRIVGAVYCGNKAIELNRSPVGWVLFAILTPVIAMIAINFTSKKTKRHQKK
jgi:ATP/ADP translocase